MSSSLRKRGEWNARSDHMVALKSPFARIIFRWISHDGCKAPEVGIWEVDSTGSRERPTLPRRLLIAQSGVKKRVRGDPTVLHSCPT